MALDRCFDGVIGYSGGAGVVYLKWCGRLWMPEFIKNGTQHCAILCIVKKSSDSALAVDAMTDFRIVELTWIGGGEEGGGGVCPSVALALKKKHPPMRDLA
jgi:hypothetical protein